MEQIPATVIPKVSDTLAIPMENSLSLGFVCKIGTQRRKLVREEGKIRGNGRGMEGKNKTDEERVRGRIGESAKGRQMVRG